jgi:hypothetical protein
MDDFTQRIFTSENSYQSTSDRSIPVSGLAGKTEECLAMRRASWPEQCLYNDVRILF